jgi:hypothetical protein
MARDVGTGILYIAGAGAVVALLANLDDIRNSKEVKEHWWLLPLGIIGLGYMLRKRNSQHAGAVVAVGGALFALSYMAKKKAEHAKQQQEQPKEPAPQQALFGGDTAAPTAFLPQAPGAQRGVWVQTRDGRLIQLPLVRVPTRRTQYTMV